MAKPERPTVGKLPQHLVAAAESAARDRAVAQGTLGKIIVETAAQREARLALVSSTAASDADFVAQLVREEQEALQQQRLVEAARVEAATMEFLKKEGLLNQGANGQAPEMRGDDDASIALALSLQESLVTEGAGQGPAGDAELALELQKLEEQRASGTIKIVGGAAKLSPPQLDRGRGGGDDSNC